ncbi:FecR family protein [Emticicia sp. C21]|uniref:FecR family protein n=1 Tax=Emticicia sp. C21 TaxID=2302915 RepID=UPI000E348D11|nr:FecR family protein [Emticicia sp. C21]RFS17435.1 FecR family protein [Emticicia sp. C21]
MTKNYETYTLEEFITDEDFIRWVKYPTQESEQFFQALIQNTPSLAKQIHTAKLAVQQLVIASKQDAPANEIPFIWTDIEEHLTQVQTPRAGLQISWRYWAAAASVILMVGVLFWVNKNVWVKPTSVYTQLTTTSSKPIKEVINTSAGTMPVSMPDGSEAVLQPNSRLSYNESFNGDLREVYLSGEAFFEVKKNAKIPFVVYANGLVTKVLGTSFSIKAYEQDKQVSVDVKTGKVSVYAQQSNQTPDPETKGVVLTPNQQVVYSKENEQLTRTLVAKPTILLNTQELQKFSFKNAPVDEIFSALQKAYGVEIIYDKEVMSNCRLTTSLTNETLFEKLDIICAALDATYKLIDAQVVITSNGCN